MLSRSPAHSGWSQQQVSTGSVRYYVFVISLREVLGITCLWLPCLHCCYTNTRDSNAWGTWAFNPERSATSLAGQRTSSRSSRTSGGAIHASGRRFMRNRSARSEASRASFFTRRYAKPFTPTGWARWTRAPQACRTSTAQVPAVRGLQDDLGVRAGLFDLEGECDRIVVDAYGLEDFAVGGLTHDHASDAGASRCRHTEMPSGPSSCPGG